MFASLFINYVVACTIITPCNNHGSIDYLFSLVLYSTHLHTCPKIDRKTIFRLDCQGDADASFAYILEHFRRFSTVVWRTWPYESNELAQVGFNFTTLYNLQLYNYVK